MQEETYKANGYCENCKKYIVVQVPKGMKKQVYFEKNKTCPECGCDTVRGAML